MSEFSTDGPGEQYLFDGAQPSPGETYDATAAQWEPFPLPEEQPYAATADDLLVQAVLSGDYIPAEAQYGDITAEDQYSLWLYEATGSGYAISDPYERTPRPALDAGGPLADLTDITDELSPAHRNAITARNALHAAGFTDTDLHDIDPAALQKLGAYANGGKHLQTPDNS